MFREDLDGVEQSTKHLESLIDKETAEVSRNRIMIGGFSQVENTDFFYKKIHSNLLHFVSREEQLQLWQHLEPGHHWLVASLYQPIFQEISIKEKHWNQVFLISTFYITLISLLSCAEQIHTMLMRYQHPLRVPP